MGRPVFPIAMTRRSQRTEAVLSAGERAQWAGDGLPRRVADADVARKGSDRRAHEEVMERPVYVGCDDAGFETKQLVLRVMDELGLPYVDCGSGDEPSRYPYFAAKVASAVSEGRAERGILLCGSGIGMSIAANKFPGVRAAAVSDVYGARLTRRHNDSNVLCLGGRLLGAWTIAEIVRVWLTTDYDGGHHEGSLALLREIESVTMSGARWCPEAPPYAPFGWDPAQKP